MSLLWYMHITTLGMQLLGLAHNYLLFEREPRLPVDVEFGLQRGGQMGSPGEPNYISQLSRRLRFTHKKAKHMAQKQQAKTQGVV